MLLGTILNDIEYRSQRSIRFIANTDFCIDYPLLMHCGIEKGANDHSICPLLYPTMHQKRIINAKISIYCVVLGLLTSGVCVYPLYVTVLQSQFSLTI